MKTYCVLNQLPTNFMCCLKQSTCSQFTVKVWGRETQQTCPMHLSLGGSESCGPNTLVLSHVLMTCTCPLLHSLLQRPISDAIPEGQKGDQRSLGLVLQGQLCSRNIQEQLCVMVYMADVNRCMTIYTQQGSPIISAVLVRGSPKQVSRCFIL